MKKILCLIITSLICLSLCACSQKEEIPYANEAVKVLFLNVGSADAMLVCVDGKNYMIDTGEEETAYRLLAALNYMGASKLDGLILTHTHSDHIGGAKLLCENVETDKLYSAVISENKNNGENKIDNIAKKYSLEQIELNAGDKIEITDSVAFSVLGPIVLNEDDDNDNSLVLKLNVNSNRVLFTGDMQFSEELTLLNRGTNLKAEVLKVGNHGNRDATSEQFANAVSPKYAIITTDVRVDENSANERVKKALSMSEIMVTSDYDLGVLMTIGLDGSITFENAEIKKDGDFKLEIIETDAKTQTVTIYNPTNAAVDIGKFMLVSENGGELFVFPDGSKIESGKSITVACEGSNGDYIWNGENKAWNKKKGDIAILYDSLGFELSRMTVNAVS